MVKDDMKDQVLAALMNLLAHFASMRHVQRNRATWLIDVFLTHLGVQNKQEYMNLFEVASDVYELRPQDDAEQSAMELCQKLKAQFTMEEQVLFGLRIMEFIEQAEPADTPDEKHDDDGKETLYRRIMQALDFPTTVHEDVLLFLKGEASDSVASIELGGGKGRLKVLRIGRLNKLIGCYMGEEPAEMNGLRVIPGFYFIWPKNGVLSVGMGQVYYHSYALSLLHEEETGAGVHVAARHLEFRFPKSDNGLHDFSFDLHGGELVAVMGGSGVGKSTLLSILNGSLPPDSGSLTIDGRSLYDHLDEVKPLMGFVPQDDLLIPELTVRENLYYTALFCFAGEKNDAIEERVEKTLSDLGLAYIADLKVGSPLEKTISGGQRKRLNIALELIREPSVLFLDEPTSGLSSADSERVMHMLKEQTFRQRLVIVNIHQPSSDIYKLFDRLWLLDKGGYPIYDGNNIEAISHFKKMAQLADAETSVCPTCGNVTPDVVLSIVEQTQLDAHGRKKNERVRSAQDWHQLYLNERVEDKEQAAEKNPCNKEESGAKASGSQSVKPSTCQQFLIYLRRTFKTFFSDRQALLITLLEAPLLALIVAWLTHYSGERGYCLMDNKNLMSYMFMAIIVATFMGMSGAAEAIFRDRAILRRERFLQLSYKAYIASKICHQALVVGLQTLLFVSVGNMMLEIKDLFLVWWAVLFVSGLLAALIGLLLSQRMRTIVSIYITIPLLLIPQILLCGLVVPFTDLMPHTRTNYVPLIGEVIPSRWSFEALAVTAFTDNEFNRNYFCNKALQSEMQLARDGYIHFMQKALQKERKNYYDSPEERTDNINMLRHEAAKLAERWDVELFPTFNELGNAPWDKNHCEAFEGWLEQLCNDLYNRSYTHTRAIDADQKEYVRTHGKGALSDLRKYHTNLQLEAVLTNAQSTHLVHQEGDVLVPDVAAIYLSPTSQWGRAPFYAHSKMVGGHTFTTLQFNMMVLGVMMLVITLLLLRGYKE